MHDLVKSSPKHAMLQGEAEFENVCNASEDLQHIVSHVVDAVTPHLLDWSLAHGAHPAAADAADMLLQVNAT